MSMREILFRGKRIDNGEWIEGTPFQEYNNFWGEWLWFIQTKHPLTNVPYLHLEIDKKTVGQFTGLTDKNGKKIFEGDIFPIEDEIIAVVIFKNGCFRMEEYGLCGAWTESGFDECGGGWGIIECCPIDWYNIIDMEVIGNIHDNPELLGGVNDYEQRMWMCSLQ